MPFASTCPSSGNKIINNSNTSHTEHLNQQVTYTVYIRYIHETLNILHNKSWAHQITWRRMLSSLISMLRLAEWPRVCSALITALQRTLGMIGNDFVKMISWCIANQHRAPLEVILPDQYQQFTCKCWKHNAAGKTYQSPCRVYKLTHQNQKCGLGNLCSAMFYTLGKSESRENFWCLRPSVVSPLQETYTFLRWGKKISSKKNFPVARYSLPVSKCFFVERGAIVSPFWKGNFKPHMFKHQNLLDV